MSKKESSAGGSELDDAVIAALREGYREFLRYLRLRIGNAADAEDILQDFYLKVVRSAQTIRNTGSLRSWLSQVLRRTLTDYYRKTAVRKQAQQRLESEEGVALLIDDESERAVCACLYRILPTLPSDYAQIIWRVDLLGQPRAKVARSFGVSLNNLGVRVHRARRSLRAALERFCTTCPVHGFLNCACEDTPARRFVDTKPRARVG
jgi:RNA polymerase sigma-70 factor (ECF subfamily)